MARKGRTHALPGTSESWWRQEPPGDKGHSSSWGQARTSGSFTLEKSLMEGSQFRGWGWGGRGGEDGVSNSECKQTHTPPQVRFTDQCSLRSVFKPVPQGVECSRDEIWVSRSPHRTHSWVGLSCSRDPSYTQGGGPQPARPPTLLKPATLPAPSARTQEDGAAPSFVGSTVFPASGLLRCLVHSPWAVCPRLRPAHTLSLPPARHPPPLAYAAAPSFSTATPGTRAATNGPPGRGAVAAAPLSVVPGTWSWTITAHLPTTISPVRPTHIFRLTEQLTYRFSPLTA